MGSAPCTAADQGALVQSFIKEICLYVKWKLNWWDFLHSLADMRSDLDKKIYLKKCFHHRKESGSFNHFTSVELRKCSILLNKKANITQYYSTVISRNVIVIWQSRKKLLLALNDTITSVLLHHFSKVHDIMSHDSLRYTGTASLEIWPSKSNQT